MKNARIKRLRLCSFCGWPSGKVMQVTPRAAKQLIADGLAKPVKTKKGGRR